MRMIALPIAALVLVSASPPESSVLESGVTHEAELPTQDSDEAVCRDRIHEAREANGQPRLDRDTASPDRAYLIAAVDQRIGGCSVMVMRNDTSDIRPLPTPLEKPGLFSAD